MHTLKEFYEAQVADLQAERNDIAEEALALRNEVAAARDILAGKGARIRQLEGETEEAREQAEQTRERLAAERRKIDQVYEEMGQVRESCQQAIDKANARAASLEEENRTLAGSMRMREAEAEGLKEKIYRL